MLKLAFAFGAGDLRFGVTLAPGRVCVARLEIRYRATSLGIARAVGLAVAAKLEERMEEVSFTSAINAPVVDQVRSGQYRVWLDVELVDEADMPTARAFLQAFADAVTRDAC